MPRTGVRGIRPHNPVGVRIRHSGNRPLGLANERLQVVHRNAELLADLNGAEGRKNSLGFPTAYGRVADAQLAGDGANPSEARYEVR